MFASEMAFEATFLVRATANEIVIWRRDGDLETELSRVPFEAKPDLSDLSAKLAVFYRKGIYRQVKSM